MHLIPIAPTADENRQFIDNPLCAETIYMSMNFYDKVGFHPPWICYYAMLDRKLVGSAAFKGRPVNGRVEIAYGTFEEHRMQGIATRICRELVELSLYTDNSVRITARTLPENKGSMRVLEKNGFTYTGMVNDEEDGEVCEWEYGAIFSQARS
jgi:[ribosomal protein S5]-alanine N-acetyltransferase